MKAEVRPIGYVTDERGRKLFALVPMVQLPGSCGDPLPDAARPEDEAIQLQTAQALHLELSVPVNPIRLAREAAEITQSDLAKAMGISQPMLSRQEQVFRKVRPSTVKRALAAIERIRENRARPLIPLGEVLNGFGSRLEESASRKPRDPVERQHLREAGDPVAKREDDRRTRQDGTRQCPPKRRP